MSSFLRATTASTRAVLQAAQRPRISPNRISQTRLISASPVLAAKGSKKKGSRDDEDAPTTVILSTKGKGKSRHNHNEELVPGHASALEEVDAIDSEKVQNKMKNAVEWFRKEVASLESRGSGRVSTALLDPVKVSLNKGEQSVRLQEVATVSVREGNVLVVSVFEDEVSTVILPKLSIPS